PPPEPGLLNLREPPARLVRERRSPTTKRVARCCSRGVCLPHQRAKRISCGSSSVTNLFPVGYLIQTSRGGVRFKIKCLRRSLINQYWLLQWNPAAVLRPLPLQSCYVVNSEIRARASTRISFDFKTTFGFIVNSARSTQGDSPK